MKQEFLIIMTAVLLAVALLIVTMQRGLLIISSVCAVIVLFLSGWCVSRLPEWKWEEWDLFMLMVNGFINEQQGREVKRKK